MSGRVDMGLDLSAFDPQVWTLSGALEFTESCRV